MYLVVAFLEGTCTLGLVIGHDETKLHPSHKAEQNKKGLGRSTSVDIEAVPQQTRAPINEFTDPAGRMQEL